MARATSRVSGVLMTGPLAPFADAYGVALSERGYTQRSAVSLLRQMARLSCWLEERGLAAAELSVARVEEFLVVQRAGGRHRSGWSRPGLVCLVDMLNAVGVVAVDESAMSASATEMLLDGFTRHLVGERGLAAGTIGGYVRHAQRFLVGLPPGCGLVDVTARDVMRAVLEESETLSVSATQNFVSGLRSFLWFCFIEGLVEVDLSQAALGSTGRRRSTLPLGISRADAKALLKSCDRRRSLGRRDYAVIITLLRLGLRRAEVAGLCLDDIDWRAGEVVVRGKGGRQDRLPLPAEVGEAIADYLRRGRPLTDHRELFLRVRAPFSPIKPGTVASTVRRACRRAGITEVGPHRLRHSVACEMVAAEVPLVEIAQVLRHRSLQSTAVYARVNIDQLRLVGAPWPGGEQR
jgi:integrase/recombinase XerD